jgi:hypothetical protein
VAANTNNKLLQDGVAGFISTGDFRIPRRGELYLVPPSRSFSAQVVVSGGKVRTPFEILQVEPLPEPEKFYVQVQVASKFGRWTYEDPTGTLEYGERVVVPFGLANHEAFGTVVELTKGDWDGPIKSVYARVLTEELVAP